IALQLAVGVLGRGRLGGDRGAGGIGRQTYILRVERCQRLAFLYRRAGIDKTLDDLAADAEGVVDFIAGADFTGVELGFGARAGSDFIGECWARRGGAYIRPAAGRQAQHGGGDHRHGDAAPKLIVGGDWFSDNGLDVHERASWPWHGGRGCGVIGGLGFQNSATQYITDWPVSYLSS